MKNHALIKVQEYERNKIYRLNRRIDGLNELLDMIPKTKIKLEKNCDLLENEIKKDIIDCKNKIQKWWNIIGYKYNLPTDKVFNFIYDSGEIFLKVNQK